MSAFDELLHDINRELRRGASVSQRSAWAPVPVAVKGKKPGNALSALAKSIDDLHRETLGTRRALAVDLLKARRGQFAALNARATEISRSGQITGKQGFRLDMKLAKLGVSLR